MSKYASLPDLDTAPDVYETPDVADNYEAEPASPPNENIDTSSTNTSEAAKRFAGSDFDNSLTNYSNRIDRQQKSFSSGVAGESRDEKLARIKLELAELSESSGDNKNEVDELHVMLEGLEVKKKELKILHVDRDSGEAGTVAKSVQKSTIPTSATSENSVSVNKLTSLEKRLAAIEASLYDPNSPETTPLPLAPAIRDLMLKLSLLTSSPQTLQAQQNRIQNVKKRGSERGESRAESRAESRVESRMTESRESETASPNADIVYAHMSTITYLSHVVPGLVLRLKTLREVHSMASQSVETQASVSQQIQELEGAVKKWTEVLETVEKKLA
ncbi:hypothetical protein CJU89_2908 [Yarrowia sp. B02]|nr:hypothetical protein CJU89_2908 [Yarrowia sp. B02]